MKAIDVALKISIGQDQGVVEKVRAALVQFGEAVRNEDLELIRSYREMRRDERVDSAPIAAQVAATNILIGLISKRVIE